MHVRSVQTAFKADPDETNERVCVAEWNNCAYTITSLGMHAIEIHVHVYSTLALHKNGKERTQTNNTHKAMNIRVHVQTLYNGERHKKA